MGRRAGHSDRSAAESHSRLAEIPMLFMSCCSHVERGLPGGDRQVMSGRKLRCFIWTAMWRTLWAGVSGESRRMWPNNACRLWLMILIYGINCGRAWRHLTLTSFQVPTHAFLLFSWFTPMRLMTSYYEKCDAGVQMATEREMTIITASQSHVSNRSVCLQQAEYQTWWLQQTNFNSF